MTVARRRFLHAAAGLATLPLLPGTALAQESYPSRPIHLVIGFTPGAATDVVSRVLAKVASPTLGQQIAVENKPGAGSSIAADYVAHAAKDGYTLYLTTVSIITNQLTNPNRSLDLMRDLDPITLLESGALVLVVNPQSSVHSVKELIEYTKAHPNDVLHATVIGTMPHFVSELFSQRAGIKFTQVPYQGSPETIRDVLAGRALVTFSPASTVVSLIEAGKLRALAVTTAKRASALPNVPTLEQEGMSDFDVSLWFGLWAPAGTPRPIIDKLASVLSKAAHNPEAVSALSKQGYDPLDGGPDRFATFLRSEIARWTDVAHKAGLAKS